jgi:hypothetical protein
MFWPRVIPALYEGCVHIWHVSEKAMRYILVSCIDIIIVYRHTKQLVMILYISLDEWCYNRQYGTAANGFTPCDSCLVSG